MELILITNAVAFLVAAVAWSKRGATNFLIKVVMAALCLTNALAAVYVLGYMIKIGG